MNKLAFWSKKATIGWWVWRFNLLPSPVFDVVSPHSLVLHSVRIREPSPSVALAVAPFPLTVDELASAGHQ